MCVWGGGEYKLMLNWLDPSEAGLKPSIMKVTSPNFNLFPKVTLASLILEQSIMIV